MDYAYSVNRIINVHVLCDFTGSKPAFIVRKIKPDWVECVDPLLRVEFKEQPWETHVLAEVDVTKNAVRYALPFVEGENPHVGIVCESHKATIVFDFGPEGKQSITIDFLNDLAMKFSPTRAGEVVTPEVSQWCKQM